MPVQLDCRDLRCPMPIVKLAIAIRELEIGEQICVEANDAAFLPDVEAWSRMSGNEIVELIDGDVQRAVIRRCR